MPVDPVKTTPSYLSEIVTMSEETNCPRCGAAYINPDTRFHQCLPVSLRGTTGIVMEDATFMARSGEIVMSEKVKCEGGYTVTIGEAEKPRSAKHEAVRNTLPEERRQEFDELVRDYKYASTINSKTQSRNGGWVAYGALAELIRMGWTWVPNRDRVSKEKEDGK